MNLGPLQGVINAFTGILEGAQNNPQQYEEPGDWFEQTQDNPFALILHSIMNLLRVGFDNAKSNTEKMATAAKTAVGIIFGILSLLVPKSIMSAISGFFKPIMNAFKGLFGGDEQAENQAPEGEVRLDADAEADVELEAQGPAVEQPAPQQNIGQRPAPIVPQFNVAQMVQGIAHAAAQHNAAQERAHGPDNRLRNNL